MAEKSSLKTRHIIGAIIRDKDASLELGVLIQCQMLFMWRAADDIMDLNQDPPIVPPTSMMVESDETEILHKSEKLVIICGDREGLEKTISAYRNSEKEGLLAEMPDSTQVEEDRVGIVVGSPEYCAAFVRYMAMDRHGACADWSELLVGKLKKMTLGDVVWWNNLHPNRVFTDTLIKMHKKAFPEKP